MTLTHSDKLLISCISGAFLMLLWVAKPKVTDKKQVLGFMTHGRPAIIFRSIATAAIVFVNIGVWAMH